MRSAGLALTIGLLAFSLACGGNTPAPPAATAAGAVDAATAGDVGKMVALKGTDIELVPLSAALDAPKLLDPAFFETAEVFFG